ncbi:MAG: hypothetical protein WCV93_04290 [Candidatus Shapirobacteria bacterium]|jgi:hypothetical protein
MKKILISFVTVIALTASVAAGTRAIFSGNDKVLGNTVTTARISIDAETIVNKPLNITGLLPGQSGSPGTVDLVNDGDAPQIQYMYVENVAGTLCPALDLTIGYSVSSPGVFSHTFGTWKLADITGPANRQGVGETVPVSAGSNTRLVQQASLASSVSDPSLMGATCTWDEVFVGEQVQ